MPALTISQKEAAAKKKVYPVWHDFVAGAVAGAGARMLTHPLDLVRIRRQLASFQQDPNATVANNKKPTVSMWRDMVQVVQNEGGIRGLFRGNMAAINLWVSYTAIQFSAYGHTRAYFQTVFPDESQRSVVAFCAGASAGVTATLSSYPLDLCRTIFAARGATVELEASIAAAGEQSSSSATATPATAASKTSQQHEFRPPKTAREFATNLYKQRGWKGFFAGCSPTVIQIIPYMGFSFAIYDYLTYGDRGVGLSAYAGSIAGAVSKTLVYPMDTVKKRLQAQSFFGAKQQTRCYTGIADCVTQIYQKEGYLAFYNGLVPSVIKTGLAAGLSFAFFRSAKNFLESVHDNPFSNDDPPTRKSFHRRLSGQ